MEKNSKMQVFWALLTLMLVVDSAVIIFGTDLHDSTSLFNCGLMGVLVYTWRRHYKPRDP